MRTNIFKGKTKPGKSWVGTENQKEIYRDKFGEMQIGEVRSTIINTKWGQLDVPFRWIGKKIKITIEEDKS